MSWVWYHLGYHLLRHIKQFNDLFHSQRIQPPIRRMKIPPSLSVFSKSKHHFNVLGYLFLWPIMIICHQIIIPNQARILSRNRRIVAAHRETKWNENENRRKPAPCSNHFLMNHLNRFITPNVNNDTHSYLLLGALHTRYPSTNFSNASCRYLSMSSGATSR